MPKENGKSKDTERKIDLPPLTTFTDSFTNILSGMVCSFEKFLIAPNFLATGSSELFFIEDALKREELKKLRKDYLALPDVRKVNLDPAILGFNAISAKALENAILKDLDAENFGIGWWKDYPLGEKRRIFIGDYLHQCAATVVTNLTEAKISLMELRGNQEKIQKLHEDLIDVSDPSRPKMRHKTKASVDGLLVDWYQNIYLCSFFRAIGSAADCLAACIIGVTALPTKIFSAGYSSLKLISAQKISSDQSKYLESFSETIENQGPKGWLDWALGFRNMVVHRGRLVQIKRPEFVPAQGINGILAHPKGYPLGKTVTKSILAAEPDLSEIELLSYNFEGLYLTEDTLTTAEGVFASTESMVEKISSELCEIWTKRSDNPQLLVQPAEQWPEVDRRSRIRFEGYCPGQIERGMSQIEMNTATGHRWKAASLYDHQRKNWDSFS